MRHRHRPTDLLAPRPRDARRKIPAEAEAAFRADYLAGMRLVDLGARYGVSFATAWREARRLRLPRRYSTRAA